MGGNQWWKSRGWKSKSENQGVEINWRKQPGGNLGEPNIKSSKLLFP